MISDSLPIPLLVRVAARVAWSNDRRIATKLHGFALTEAGSAHDMFRAAELTTDPRHRRLYLRHALDEARHARRFRDSALAFDPRSRPRSRERAHALPQDLFRRLGSERFLAFVHLSEARAQRHFEALARHFQRRDPAGPLARLFAEVAREERVHVAYSRHLLGELHPAAVRALAVSKALARERRALAWEAWKRAGVRLGARVTTLLMALVFVVALPLFAALVRLSRRGLPAAAWHRPDAAPADRAAARRQA